MAQITLELQQILRFGIGLLAIVMFLGRYVPLGLMLAIAGSFTVKDRKEVIEP